MGIIIDGVYVGNKKARLKHEPSGAELITVAPKDNFGAGNSFSPTDLVASALGACMMLIMSIAGEREGMDLSGMRMRVEKEMTSAPRRIGKLTLELHLPARLTAQERERLERVARECPVLRSIHPDVIVDARFVCDV